MSDPQPAQQPHFSIEKLYIKDVSLEVPNAPQIFLEREAPEIDVKLSTASGQVNEGFYETSISVTITAKLKDKTVFLVEVTQAGIFQIRNIGQTDMDAVIGITCPNIIFPYLRETVSDLVTRAGFPPVLLNPMNFEALFQQQQAAKQEGAPVTTH